MKFIKKLFRVLMAAVLVIVLVGLICFGLASDTSDDTVFNITPSGELPFTVAKSVLLENKLDIPESELNSYLAYLINSMNTITDNEDGYSLTGVYIDFRSGGISRCYIRISKGERSYIFENDCVIAYDGDTITIRFTNFCVGKLNLPDFVAKRILNMVDLKKADRYVNTDTLTAALPCRYSIGIEEIGASVSVVIEELTVTDDGVTIVTNPVVNDTLHGIADSIIDKLSGLLSKLGGSHA